MLPWLIAAAFQAGSGFLAAPSTHNRSADVFNNGEQVDGDYWVRSNGGLDWIGDVGGTSVEDSWWTPEGAVEGDWWVRINYVGTGGDVNQIDPLSTSDLATWYKIAGSGSASRKFDFRKTTSGSSGGSTTGTYDVLFSQDAGSSTYHTLTLTITLTEPSL